MGRYAVDVIANCAFTKNPDSYRSSNITFLQMVSKFFTIKLYVIAIMTMIPARLIKMMGISIFPSSSMEYLSMFVKNLINERQEKKIRGDDFLQLLIDTSQEQGQSFHEKENEETDASSGSESITAVAINESSLSQNEVIGNAILFLVAGYTSTTDLIAFAFYSLALNQEIQEKLFKELKAAGELNYEKLASLHYLDAIVHETLRMYPPAVLERESQDDYTFPGTDITIPKKTIVAIPVSSVHYDPEFYPEPEKFDPTRFLPKNRSKLIPYTFLPFGIGMRNCLGMRFALLEAKLVIARTVLEVRIKPTPRTAVPPKFKPGPLLEYEPLFVAAQLR